MSSIDPMKYVRASRLGDTEGYCPIRGIWVTRQEDGTYLGGYSEVTLWEDDFIDAPGFLVIHLGSIERDHTVETAASALHHSLKSLFAA
jgi:hypothetical protein